MRLSALKASQWCRSTLVHDLESGLPAQRGTAYDLVLMSHVLEHLRSPDRALADAYQLLQQSKGWLVVALPNVLFWRQRARFLVGDFRYANGGLMDDTHVRFYTFDTGQALLHRNGFYIVHRHAYGSFPLQPLRSVLPKWISRGIDRAAASRFPGLFGYQMVFAAQARA